MRGARWWLLSALALAACSEPGRAPEYGCAYASDCGAGEACVGGKCEAVAKQLDPACSADIECPAAQPHCDLAFGACRQCMSNDHCPSEWTCERGACVDMRAECTHDGACRPPDTICSQERCVPGCDSPGSAIACTGNQVCDSSSGRCITSGGCRVDFDCDPPSSICIEGGACAPGCLASGCISGDRCNEVSGRCEPESIGQQCASDVECAPPTTICEGAKCKAGCMFPGGARCGELEICEASSGRCAPAPTCLSEADCPSVAPICGPEGRCMPGCDQAGGGCPNGEVCNTTSGLCEPTSCTTNGDCASPTPTCDPTSGACYGCTSDVDCAEPTPSCNLTTGACYGCLSNPDCSATPATPICAPDLGVCVGCAENSDCVATPASAICDETTSTCRGCTGAGDCSGNTPTCNLPSGTCVGCASGADCTASAPVCETGTGACRGCTANGECGGATPVCHVPSGLCLECLSNADCPAAEPTCNATTGTCELLPPQPLGNSCAINAECQSQTCWDFGAGPRCVRSCTAPVDCDNGTTCHMMNGARMCMNPMLAPASSEDVDCSTDADCTGGNLCAWIEDAPGHFDQVCRGPIGAQQPQTACSNGNQCRNGICTLGVNQPGGLCRFTCASNADCPPQFACYYEEYSGQSFTQAVRACLPLASPNPLPCGIDSDCSAGQVCSIFDEGSANGFQYWANACFSP